MVQRFQMYVDGRWRDSASEETFESVNPFNQEVWATVPSATDQDVKDAIAAARTAFQRSWQYTSGIERASLIHRLGDLLEENADRFALLETIDNGKVIRETRAQMLFAARVYRFFAGYADKIWGSVIPLDQRDMLDFTVRAPCGVVGILTAWNSPISLLANKLPAALAAGNCVVIKPSEHASATTLEFCAVNHRETRDDDLGRVRIVDSHDGLPVGRRCDDAFFDSKRTDGRAHVAAVTAVVDSSGSDRDLSKGVVDIGIGTARRTDDADFRQR